MNRVKYQGIRPFVVTLALILTACSSPQQRASQPTSFAEDRQTVREGRVTQAELQDDLLRFESQFNARIQSANYALETSADLQIRYRSALNRLVYSSNSLNIALGPSPESNLLDMVTFVELSRDVLVKHWIPNVFGPEGQSLEQAFTESRQQIWGIAEKVLTVEQRSVLHNVITAWRKKHPKQINVETVRLSAFSTEAGAKAAGLDQQVGGLFASVQESTQAVDEARLFAERALYYAERAPFLFRLQARLGAHEIVEDAGLSLAQLPSLSGNERTIRALLEEFQQTLHTTQAALGDANSTVKSVGALLRQISDDPQGANSATAAITQLTVLLKEWNRLVSSAPYQKGVSQMAGIAAQVNAESNRFLKRLTWLAAGLIAFFWAMYVFSKLTYQYFLVKVLGRAKPRTRSERQDKAA